MTTIRVAGAQINLRVGDLEYNENRILEAMDWAEPNDADVLLLPELAIAGYPPEDLVMREGFVDGNRAVLDRLAVHAAKAVTVVGFVDRSSPKHRGAADAVDRDVANAVALLHDGHVGGVYHKVLLPNYGVFDEDRYFVPGGIEDAVWDIGGVAVGVSICEDIWVADGPPARPGCGGCSDIGECERLAVPDGQTGHARPPHPPPSTALRRAGRVSQPGGRPGRVGGSTAVR